MSTRCSNSFEQTRKIFSRFNREAKIYDFAKIDEVTIYSKIQGVGKRDSSWFCQSNIFGSGRAVTVYFFQVVVVFSTATWRHFIAIAFLDPEIWSTEISQNHVFADLTYFAICTWFFRVISQYLEKIQWCTFSRFECCTDLQPDQVSFESCIWILWYESAKNRRKNMLMKMMFFFEIFMIFSKSYLSF